MKRFKYALALTGALAAVPACAVTITPDYSLLGTVYQLSDGQLSNTNMAGATDVTGLFKTNVATAINYWQNAVLLPWSTTFFFQLAPLGSAVGDNLILTFDANDRPTSSRLRVDSDNAVTPADGNVVSFFLDPTPADNSEFAPLSSTSAALGGGMVNVSRFGTAANAPANSGYDLLSLLLHEIEHGLGFSSGTTRWNNVVNAAGDTLTVPTSVTGLPSSFDIPIAGTHIDGNAQGGLFNDTSIALPGFGSGERALLTAVDIYGICTIQGCAANQLNSDPTATAAAVPEPGTGVLVATALPLLAGLAFRRRRPRAQACMG